MTNIKYKTQYIVKCVTTCLYVCASISSLRLQLGNFDENNYTIILVQQLKLQRYRCRIFAQVVPGSANELSVSKYPSKELSKSCHSWDVTKLHYTDRLL